MLSIIKCNDKKELDDIPWQSKTRNICQRLGYLYYSQDYSDLTVEVEDGTTFKVHKIILAMHSPVFETMFYGSLSCIGDKMKLTDTSSAVFEWITSYMYLGRFTLNDENLATQIYVFAHEKQIEMVVGRCSKYLSRHITSENAISILQMAHLYDDDQLKSEANTKVFSMRSNIFSSDWISHISKSILVNIITQETLPCSEKVLFECLVRWTKLQLNKKNVPLTPEAVRTEMKDFIPHIQFLSMTSEYFVSAVLPTGIFSPKDAVGILRGISGKTQFVPKNLSLKKVDRASCNEDGEKTVYRLTISKYAQCNVSFLYNNLHETIAEKLFTIKVTEKLHLSAVKLQSNCHTGHWKLKVFNSENTEVGSSLMECSPWIFDPCILLSANESYIFKIVGRGRRCKHKFSDYEIEDYNRVIFTGLSVACNIIITYMI